MGSIKNSILWMLNTMLPPPISGARLMPAGLRSGLAMTMADILVGPLIVRTYKSCWTISGAEKSTSLSSTRLTD